MNLEKINGNIKWYRENKLKIKLKDMGKSQRFGLCSMDTIFAFKPIMFDFVERIKEDLMLNVSIKKVWNKSKEFL